MSWESQAIALLAASLVRPLGLAAAAWLLPRVLRVRHPASRHAVWTAVLIGMTVLPLVSVIAPHWRLPVLPRKQDSAVQPVATGPAAFTAAPLHSAALQAAFTFESAGKPVAGFEWPAAETLVLGCYFAGFLAMVTYRAVGWALLLRLVSRSRRLSRHLRESGDVVTPIAVGLLRPAVILPVGWREWNAKTRRAVLAHEFAHLRRRDGMVAALARVAQCLFWFHPLAWWISRKLAELAELACDAAALERVDDPAGYARILLAFAGAVNRAGTRVVLPGLAMASSADVGRRIDQVFALSDGNLGRLSRPGLVLAALGLPAMALASIVTLGEPAARPPRPIAHRSAALSPSATQVAEPIQLAQAVRQPATAAQATPRQAPAQPLAFEVASVKPAIDPGRVPIFCIVPCAPGEHLTILGSRVDIRYMSLKRLILKAYGIKPYQLSGPEWMGTERFDIAARIPGGVAPSAAASRLPEMLQSLLAERFKLSIHRENKEHPVYALVVGKNGPKLQEASADAGFPPPNESSGNQELYTPDGEAYIDKDGNATITSGPLGPIRAGPSPTGGHGFEFLKLTMPGLADVLTPHLDRPVVDMTELKGAYHLTVNMQPPSGEGGGRKTASPDGRPGGGPDSDPPPDRFGEALFATIEKAGLKLEKSKAPVETIVVDHLEKTPTGN
jgi:uncharacterized protein (TIGR03435 family)